MRKDRVMIAALMLSFVLLLGGCAPGQDNENAGMPEPDRSLSAYSASFLELFDTVTYLKGYAKDEEAFKLKAQEFYDRLYNYHRLYDIYNDYEGIKNIKYLNDHAGETVTVDPELMDLLVFSKDIAGKTGGRVDITLGAVLSLWHEAREYSINNPEEAYIPGIGELEEAKKHTGFDKLKLDTEKNTVLYLDPLLRLDVGAVAKGYAVQQVCGMTEPGMLVSVGGNVAATGPKADTGSSWTVGVQDPFGTTNTYMNKVALSRGAIVSSGDYQRRFTCNGKTWHHIIDPDTLYPAELWHGVTVICSDSGIADALSTALFLSDLETGNQLLKDYGAEAVWTAMDGSIYYSDGFEKLIVK